jgi:hypothetical protein
MPALEGPIASVAFSLEGPMVSMADSDGLRKAMIDTLSFDNHAWERRHPLYGGRARARQTDLAPAPGARDPTR